jgi:hypothetical protein
MAPVSAQPENIAADIWTPGHRPTERAAIVPQPLARAALRLTCPSGRNNTERL